MLRIIYLAQSIKEPSGGTKVMYQHVDMLNELGYDASIWHDEEGFRCGVFENTTKIVYKAEGPKPDLIVTAPTPTDIGNWKKIVFDQNPYYMGQNGTNSIDAYMVVSQDSRRYIEFMFPEKPVHIVPNFIDYNLFVPNTKERIITMDGRKNWEDMEQVIRLIKPKCDKEGWKLIGFTDSSEKEVAETLGKAFLHLQFGLREGLCLMPMEAMSCGCRVIGYHGQGGVEYVDPEIWDTIPAGDIISFAETIIYRMEEFNPEPKTEARDFISNIYTRDRSMEALGKAIKSVCG